MQTTSNSIDNMVLFTGNGVSEAFNFPSTSSITHFLKTAIQNKYKSRSPEVVKLLDKITKNLRNYLVKPRNVNFEDIFQGIEDLLVLVNLPSNDAYNEYRPRVAAIHQLKHDFSCFKSLDASILEKAYLDEILDLCLDSLKLIKDVQDLKEAIVILEKQYNIWSFTINYDDILDSVLKSYETGFEPGNFPRRFDPNRLTKLIEENRSLHCHLHGSIKWGHPKPPHNVFEIYEFETAIEGVKASKSSGSRDYRQNGQSQPKSTIITGLEKPESLQRQPFFAQFSAFCWAMANCSDVIIAGYGFGDKHLNMAIEQCRLYRQDVRLYFVDYLENGDPSDFFVSNTNPFDTLIPSHPLMFSKITGFADWWKVEGASAKHLSTSPLFVYLKGFTAFCKAVTQNGLPK